MSMAGLQAFAEAMLSAGHTAKAMRVRNHRIGPGVRFTVPGRLVVPRDKPQLAQYQHGETRAEELARRQFRQYMRSMSDPLPAGEKMRRIRSTHGVGRPVVSDVPLRVLERQGHQPWIISPQQEADLARQGKLMRDAEDRLLFDAKRCRAAVEKFGSQRKAAAALGISLGKLQRYMRKAQS